MISITKGINIKKKRRKKETGKNGRKDERKEGVMGRGERIDSKHSSILIPIQSRRDLNHAYYKVGKT